MPNGKYSVVLDQKYKDAGLNEFEITITDNVCTYLMKNASETLALEWISDTAFIVKGLTEPINTADIPFQQDNSERIAFHINKYEGDTYYFHLGAKMDAYPVFAGKLVLTK